MIRASHIRNLNSLLRTSSYQLRVRLSSNPLAISASDNYRCIGLSEGEQCEDEDVRVIGCHSRFRIPPGAIDASDSLTGRGQSKAPRVFIETFIRPCAIRVIKIAQRPKSIPSVYRRCNDFPARRSTNRVVSSLCVFPLLFNDRTSPSTRKLIALAAVNFSKESPPSTIYRGSRDTSYARSGNNSHRFNAASALLDLETRE